MNKTDHKFNPSAEPALAHFVEKMCDPLTSVRSLSQILYDDVNIETGKRKEFLSIIVKEAERLTRLVNQANMNV